MTPGPGGDEGIGGGPARPADLGELKILAPRRGGKRAAGRTGETAGGSAGPRAPAGPAEDFWSLHEEVESRVWGPGEIMTLEEIEDGPEPGTSVRPPSVP